MAEDEIPYLTEGYLGPQAKFGPFGMTAVSHPDPVIHLNTNKVKIVIGMQAGTRFVTKFKRMEPIKEMPQCVLTQNKGNEMHYEIAMPMMGFYKFEVYALPADEAGPHFINVINYLVHPRVVDQCVEPYPKQYPLWKQEKCYIHEPTMLQKGVNYPVKFSFDIPKPTGDVRIKAGNDWFQLDKVDTHTYEGVVDFSTGYPSGTKVKLNVKFGRNNKYDILLEYTI